MVPILSVAWVGQGREGWQGGICFVLLCSRLSPSPSRPRPERSYRTRRGSRSGLCVRRRRGGEVRRPTGRPASCPLAPAASPSPAACRRPQLGRAGHVGASVTPSLIHTHTHPRARTRAPASRALSLADTQALTSRSWPRPAGQRPPSTQTPGPPSASSACSPDGSSRPRVTATWPNSLATAATVGTWKQPRGARPRHPEGEDTLLPLRARFR